MQDGPNSGIGATADELQRIGRLRSGAELTGCRRGATSVKQRGRWTTFTGTGAAIRLVLTKVMQCTE